MKHIAALHHLNHIPQQSQRAGMRASRRGGAYLTIFLSSLLIALVSSLLGGEHVGQQIAHAQSVNIKLDSSVSSGLMVGPSGREISITRAPFLLDLDAAFTFDGDESVEWVLGSLIQAEYTPAFAINPQVRLRKTWKQLEMFAGAGLPFFFMPYTRFGSEVSVGLSFPKEGPLSLIGNVNVQTYFLGSDLPEDSTVFTINGAVGVRMRF